ncbi:MAG: hypothetical protein ABSE62_06440 [Chthoniobacteraceae bacterium]|jgi:hypothetical protein
MRIGSMGMVALSLLGGCAWHHGKKTPPSYDKPFSDDERDPTYHPDEQRADVEVQDEQ